MPETKNVDVVVEAPKVKPTKELVARLKARVNELVAEKQALETRIREAYGEFYEAQREFERSEKPTPAMLKVLALMANGAVLKARTFAPYGYFWTSDEGSDTVRESVYLGLRSRQAIEESSENDDRNLDTLLSHY